MRFNELGNVLVKAKDKILMKNYDRFCSIVYRLLYDINTGNNVLSIKEKSIYLIGCVVGHIKICRIEGCACQKYKLNW